MVWASLGVIKGMMSFCFSITAEAVTVRTFLGGGSFLSIEPSPVVSGLFCGGPGRGRVGALLVWPEPQ